MAFIRNPQVANSPIANANTGGADVSAIVTKGATGTIFGSGGLYTEGYYLILQNTGTVNLEVLFNASADGIILYPAATFEVAVSEGTKVLLKNTTDPGTGTDGAAQVLLFA